MLIINRFQPKGQIVDEKDSVVEATKRWTNWLRREIFNDDHKIKKRRVTKSIEVDKRGWQTRSTEEERVTKSIEVECYLFSWSGDERVVIVFSSFGDNGYDLRVVFFEFWGMWLYVINSNERKRPIKDLLV